jgi:hypothetical protein
MFTTLKENNRDFALRDYTLSSTMVWKEHHFNKLIDELVEELKINKISALEKVIFTLKRSLISDPKDIVGLNENNGVFSFDGYTSQPAGVMECLATRFTKNVSDLTSSFVLA